MTTAFVLSGGGSLGAVQAGMLRALQEAGVTPDLIVGTSVGAINGAYVAGAADRDGIAGLGAIWRKLRRQDAFPVHAVRGLLAVMGRGDHVASSKGLERLLRRHLAFKRLEDAPISLHVIATDVISGRAVRLSSGDAVDAVLASAAIPGVFPPLRIAGQDLMDGGVADNTPISHAIDLGASTVYVLPAGFACALPGTPKSALAMVLQALTVLVQAQLARDVCVYEERVDLRLVPPLCPLDVSPADFSAGARLIESAYRVTRDWLSDGKPEPGQAMCLKPHSHGIVPDPAVTIVEP